MVSATRAAACCGARLALRADISESRCGSSRNQPVLFGPYGVYTFHADTSLDSVFANQQGPGWIGGDATYSTALPNGQEAFAFSDTLVGTAQPSGTAQDLWGVWGSGGTDVFAVGGGGTIHLEKLSIENIGSIMPWLHGNGLRPKRIFGGTWNAWIQTSGCLFLNSSITRRA